jgi:hypothetical protein
VKQIAASQIEGRTVMADRKQSAAYEVLRPSSRRLLMFIETEIARNGGNAVTFYNDQLEAVGSRRVVGPGLSELNALGLLRVAQYQKRHLIGLSDGWRDIASKREVLLISARARVQRPSR